MSALTYSQVLSQITGRMNRDDLTEAARDFSKDRVNFYQKELFYAGQVSDESISTEAGTTLYDFPSGWEDVHSIQYLNGSVWLPIVRREYNFIEQIDLNEPSIQSIPAYWAQVGSQFRLFPAPAIVTPLKLWMDLPPNLPEDGSSNFWTDDAQTLVIEGTIAEIYAAYLFDPVSEGIHRPLEKREMDAMSSKTIRIAGGIQTQPYF